MIYIFNEILERMVYTVDVGADTEKALVVAKEFKKLDKTTQEYTISMLQAWMDQQSTGIGSAAQDEYTTPET